MNKPTPPKKIRNLADGVDLSFFDAKKVLKKYGYTQQALADKLGVSQGALSGVLNGNPNIAQLKLLADTIGCSFWEFFDFGDNMPKDIAEKKNLKLSNAKCPACGAALLISLR